MSLLVASDADLLQYRGTGTGTGTGPLMASFSPGNLNNWVQINGRRVVASCGDLIPRVAVTCDYPAANACLEPSSVALSLAGLGLMGWLARRRE